MMHGYWLLIHHGGTLVLKKYMGLVVLSPKQIKVKVAGRFAYLGALTITGVTFSPKILL